MTMTDAAHQQTDEELAQELAEAHHEVREAAQAVDRTLLDENGALSRSEVERLWQSADEVDRLCRLLAGRVEADT